MKKFLLSLVVIVATMNAFAKDEKVEFEWQKSFTPVTDAKKLNGVHTAITSDGSVYVSSTYNTGFTFEGTEVSVADPDKITSSFIVKYNNEGVAQWAVTLWGNCTIGAMTTDTDGTLYIAGNSQDVEIVCTSTDGTTKKIINPSDDPWGIGEFSPTAYSAFVAKITTNGVFESIKTITPEVNEIIAAAEGPNPWYPDYSDEPTTKLYTMWDPIYITPNKIEVAGNNVYVSSTYLGDVKELGWNGSYLDAWGSYEDNKSYGIFSLAKSDLTNPQNVAVVQNSHLISEEQTYPDALTFVVNNGTVYIAFFAHGDITVTTSEGSRPFTCGTDNDGYIHPLVLIDTSNPSHTSIFDAKGHNAMQRPYRIFGEVVDNKFYLFGTYFGNFPLDNSITSDIENFKGNDFAACIGTEANVLWKRSYNNDGDKDDCAAGMMMLGEEIHAATTKYHYNIRTSNGELKDKEELVINDASAYNDTYAVFVSKAEASVVVSYPKLNPSGIEAIKAAAAKGETTIYNLNGQRVATPQKGLYIVNGRAAVVK